MLISDFWHSVEQCVPYNNYIFIHRPIINSLICSVSGTLTHYVIARIFLGFNFGIYCVLMSIYIAEISSQNIRGAFSSTSMFAFNIGVLLQFVLGYFLSLRATNAITFGLCVIQMISLYFVWESPYFLFASKQDDLAKRCLLWLRGSNSDAVEKEFSTIKERVEARQSLLVSIKSLFSKKNYKGFVLCMIICGLADLSGRVTILTFTTKTFKATQHDSHSSDSSHLMTIFLGICNVLFPIIPILWSDKIGRKTIIIVSSIIIVFMHTFSGFVFLFKKDYQWVLFVSLTGYLGSVSTCVTSILTLRGEIISENCRGLASGFSSMAVAFGVFVSTKSFHIVANQPGLGHQYSFWLLACFSTPLLFFTWIFIPETKNKNFEQIQMALYGTKVSVKVEQNVLENTKM